MILTFILYISEILQFVAFSFTFENVVFSFTLENGGKIVMHGTVDIKLVLAFFLDGKINFNVGTKRQGRSLVEHKYFYTK